MSKKEKVLALLREQRSEDQLKNVALMVLEKLVESGSAFDMVGTIVDEVGQMYLYNISKRALLSEFGGSIFTFIGIHRIAGENETLRLYLTHKLERSGALLEEDLELAFERIIHALTVGEGESFGENSRD